MLESRFNVGNMTVDDELFVAHLGGKVVAITETEFRILRYISRRADRIVTKKELTDLIKGQRAKIDPRIADVHICRLRRSFPSPWNLQYLRSHKGWKVIE